MPYAVIEPSGCGIVKDVAKLRVDLFLNETDPHYDKHYVFVPVIPEGGYPGAVDAEGTPKNQADYDAWLESLPHIWQNNPFHSHKIWLPDAGASDNYINEQIERTLNYFYAFHQHCWDTSVPFIENWKKVPKVKGSIRDVFVRGDPNDSLANQQKIADITNRINEFQISASRVPPTDLNIGEKGTIDVGETTNLSYDWSGYTLVDKANPANADGTIDTVLVYPNVTVTNVELATFYVVSGNNLTSRDNETYIGEIASGGERTLTGLSIDILTTDYIGLWHDSGKFYGVMSGAGGLWYAAGDKIPSDNQAFSSLATASVYLYGTGTESGGGETYNETGHEQVILAVGGQSGKQTMTEARGQVIVAEMGKADIQTMLEARGQVILVEQGHTDQAIFAETGHLQTVLASLAQTDLATFSELAHLETILAVIGESDLATFAETSHLQVILANQGESDLAIFSELGHLEEVLAILGEEDTYIPVGGVVYDETGHLQAILFMSGESDNLRFTETGKVQAILVTTGESDTATFVDAHGQVILVKLGERTIRILKKIRRKSDIHNLGRMQASYNLGTMQGRYTLGEGEKRNVIK